MGLIRRLLQDAQAKFRNMVEDNKQLAAKIDGSINAANQEVSALRAELEDTNKRLTEISSTDTVKKDYGMQVEENETECKYHMSRGMRFPSMWYVRPAKAHTSLRIRAVIRAFASHLNNL